MSPTIPDLWSDAIRVDVVTPLVILRAQESLLGRKTQGILEAKVLTATNEALVQHQLDLIAPALNRYRVTLLSAKHTLDMVYPVTVRARCFAPKPKNGLAHLMPPGPGRTSEDEPPDERTASTQMEFIELVRQVLHSDDVLAVIQSLIARSNETSRIELVAAQPPSDLPLTG